MVYGGVAINVDPTKWELYLKLYPRKGSKLIRDFIDTLILNAEPTNEDISELEINKKIEENLITASNAKINADILKGQLDQLRERSEQRTILELEEESNINDELNAALCDSNFKNHFNHKYIMSGAKDKSIDELDFYKSNLEYFRSWKKK